MVDVTQAMESGYLNADMVRESPTKKCVIMDGGEYIDAEFQGKKCEKFELLVSIDTKQKKWAPNKESVRNIAEEYGRESNKWVGKVIKLSVGKHAGRDTVNGMPIPEPKVTEEQV